MASFSATVTSPWDAARTFKYMADASNFVRWDPGTISSRQVVGNGPGERAEFDVEVSSIGRPLVLRYRTTRYEPADRSTSGLVQLEAESAALELEDRIEVTPDGDGSRVNYTAELRLKGAWRILSPVMALAFRRVVGRGADGLARALDGERVPR